MELTDVMVMYKRAKTEYDKCCIIDKIRMDSLLAKEVLEDFEAVLYIIDAKYYSTLLEAVSEHSTSGSTIERFLPLLIEKIPFYHLKSLIESLQRYYPEIKASKYRKLCEKRLSYLCKMSAVAEDYRLEMNCDCLREVHGVGIFKHSFNHYIVDEIIIPRLSNSDFFVSFRGKNKIFKDMIHAFVTTLQLEARKDGVSDEVFYLGEGSYSIVLQIGNQVLKLGKGRRNNAISYSPELVQWRFRRYFKESGLFIEVQPLLDMKDIKKEDVLGLAISSYRNHYYWSDVSQNNELRMDNVGRLRSDNTARERELNSLARYIMGRNKESDVIYKKGSCVIVDTDYFEELNWLNYDVATDEYKKHLALLGLSEVNDDAVMEESIQKVKDFFHKKS